ncbi:MAG TPA: hypothetical protein VHA11_05805, partial [Bryobacteraceae bacterium]|nr:hypothetical protein [Bryobacteraceae bacterium]
AAVAGTVVEKADDFSYTDPVDGSVSQNQGTRVFLRDGSRIVWRLSGTGTSGATLRVYLERFRTADLHDDLSTVLTPLARAAREILALRKYFGNDEPTVIT